MTRATIPCPKKLNLLDKWVALEDGVIIAEGIDLAEVYVNAMISAKTKPTFKKIPA